MKFNAVQKITKEDLAKFGQLPTWMDAFLGTLNPFLEIVVRSLRSGLSFTDNFDCKQVELKFTSGTEKRLGMPAGRRVIGIQVLEVLEKTVTGYGFSRKTNGDLGVTITWTGGGDADARVIIFFQG